MQIPSPSLISSPRCYIGLTQWQHAAWQDNCLERSSHVHVLQAYARHFSSVEGNTTFYGLPKQNTVEQWYKESSEQFRFCFKFPQEISHLRQLTHCQKETLEFFKRLTPLQEKLGLLCIQLPATFGPDCINDLENYLKSLPADWQYAVEIRHPEFFHKGDTEQQLNQLLVSQNCNRISFDTRSLFAHPADDAVSLKAKEHKPQLPVHAISTGQSPMIRFITPLDWQWGTPYLDPWLSKAITWMQQGKTPYFFFHTPDNAEAPQLAAYFVEKLEAALPGCCLFTPWQEQNRHQDTLF